jgi:DNA repair protein RadC
MKQNEKVAEIQVSYKPKTNNKPMVKTSKDAFTELYKFFPEDSIALQERFIAMYVNRGNRILGVFDMAKGGITSTVVDLRLLISVALKTVATGIILCHNHPSGNLQPSSHDISLTKKIKEACSHFDIQVLDHIVITPDGNYFSFADEGEM